MKSHSIEVAAHKARILGIRKTKNHENQNSEKATNDPLYKEGPQKNREKGNRRDYRGLVAGR